ncbi:hypothetical protein [Streptomyces sp. NPDC001502]|uniref:hypothetical protein n=1 Tax=Streptomyces sp. NPDC001502 TaxID=3364578 RepID=UPI0036D10F82
MRDRLGTLFSTVPDDGCGAYAHMRAALIECPEPGTVLNWLRNSHSARLLADLVATGRPLTHLDLDATAGDGRAARYPEHALLLRSYVRWSLLPRARRHERLRGGGFLGRVRAAYSRINRAAEFLTAMAAHGRLLREVTQQDVDT